MIQPETWKAIENIGVRVWIAVGPLIGVLIGAYIANRNQRRQWLSGRMEEEYRELIMIMTKASMTVMALSTKVIPKTENDHTTIMRTLISVTEGVNSRLFIAPVMKRVNVRERWLDAAEAFHKDGDLGRFGPTIDDLMDEIREAARRDLGI